MSFPRRVLYSPQSSLKLGKSSPRIQRWLNNYYDLQRSRLQKDLRFHVNIQYTSESVMLKDAAVEEAFRNPIRRKESTSKTYILNGLYSTFVGKNWIKVEQSHWSSQHTLLRHYSHPILSTDVIRRAFTILKNEDAVVSGGLQETAEEAEERKKQENAAKALKYTLITFGAVFVGTALWTFFVWGAPRKDNFGDEIKDQYSELPVLQQYFKRCLNEIWNYKTFLAEPSREKLLPDPVKLPYIQPPYTLLLEITDVLVHPEWTYRTGWRFRKRPGVDFFLNQVTIGHQFEVVIYTQESGFTAFPIVDALDGQKVVMYTLYRDSTKYTDGYHMKDLERINRDLNRVIMVDCNKNSVKNHRSNSIVLPKWFGNDDDRTLFDLAALLLTISGNEVLDVREVLNHYSKFDDPIAEFRKKQIEYAEKEREREQLIINLKQKQIGVPLPSFNLLPNIFRKS